MSAPTIEEQTEAVDNAMIANEGRAHYYEHNLVSDMGLANQFRAQADALDAAAKTLRGMPPESLARIGLMVLEQWGEGYSEIETIDVQELAVKVGALVETVFDPEHHNDEHGAAEFGDVWFLFSDEVNKYRAIPAEREEE